MSLSVRISEMARMNIEEGVSERGGGVRGQECSTFTLRGTQPRKRRVISARS